MSSLSNNSRGKRLSSEFKSGKIRGKKRFEGGRESKEGGRGGRGGRGRDSRERRGGGPPKNPNPK